MSTIGNFVKRSCKLLVKAHHNMIASVIEHPAVIIPGCYS